MYYFKKNRVKNLFFTLFFITFSQHVYAAESILSTSIQWDDDVNKSKLLESLPTWDLTTTQLLFDLYKTAEHDSLFKTNDNRYGILFINSFWGPIGNPFNKYTRPGKAFLIFNNDDKPLYYVAPIIHSSTDNDVYVFVKNQNQPIKLNDWVNILREKNGYKSTVKFNICNRYGSSINDSCEEALYQDETEYAINYFGHYPLTKGNPSISASRKRHEAWESKLQKTSSAPQGSILATSVQWNDIDARNKLLDSVTRWPSLQVIRDNFLKIRDIRYFGDPRVNNFSRRITWLYPDDGCWSRASAVVKDLFGPYNNVVNEFTRPSKIFAFGNLCVNTPNSPEGMVSWWFHTAPVIKDAQTNQTYVLDPSIDAKAPLTVNEWMAKIADNTGTCSETFNSVSKFNICNGYGAGPYWNCNGSNDESRFIGEGMDTMGLTAEWLDNERNRQKQLHWDPNKTLGDLPPWFEQPITY